MAELFEIARNPKNRPVPFPFVLELLEEAEPVTRPMFGCVAVYIGPKIVLILRHKKDYPHDNGVWIATTKEHHASLKKDFPTLRSIGLFGTETTSWQVLPLDSEDFEEVVTLACELILKEDPRIGTIPKSRRQNKAQRKTRRK